LLSGNNLQKMNNGITKVFHPRVKMANKNSPLLADFCKKNCTKAVVSITKVPPLRPLSWKSLGC